MIKFFRLCLIVTLFSLPPQAAMAQDLSPEDREKLGTMLTELARQEIAVGRIRIDSVAVVGNELQLFANRNCAYIPFREENVAAIYANIQELLPYEFKQYKVALLTDNHPIEELIPFGMRTKRDKKFKTFTPKAEAPLVTNLSTPYSLKYGLSNKHIAMWQSHGYYYEPKLTRWEWQRARIFQTVEDLYTQSYVLPFLVPMLENAGANVLMPRERDTQIHEVVIDNDGCRNESYYTEITAEKAWSTGTDEGFAHLRDQYVDFENPFREGTYRLTETIKKGNESFAQWVPDIPQSGKYAVYVSYKTVQNSTTDALYTVYHKGGMSQFLVNQQMGSGTWIYLGHFNFDAGKRETAKVVLSNKSAKAGRIVTADAVKIGGGYGNIARGIIRGGVVTENMKSSEQQATVVRELPPIDYPYEVSGYPRFTEGARYWMQWAGIPDSVYSESKGVNDYTDDYKSRGLWVNYLAGGSEVNPGAEGLHIPIDLSLAFHTDAGTTQNDSIIGTLGIYFTNGKEGQYANGASRYLARDLTDMVDSHIVNDIRALYEPNWSRRGMWNQSYFEARVPQVPALLLELLSHQNFADMRYGLDPRFRFTVSRAIYKGMLQFICAQHNQKYVVQPLPVDHMALRFTKANEVELTWQPVEDPLEPTAQAERYIVYTRIGDADFNHGVVVKENKYRVVQSPGLVYSYKVTALNEGGESFPSEILSAGSALNEKGTVLVVNGFDRISAPADFVSDGVAGFLDMLDHGVPYKEDISFIGSMKEFRRSVPWMDDDASGFGDSYGDYETMVIAGNSFDYPAVHGEAILKAGYSFTSCSDEAVEQSLVDLKQYKIVDLILGKERQTKMGRGGVMPLQYKTFTDAMQTAIAAYCEAGGNIFVSGAFVGTDLWDADEPKQEDKDFAMNVLKYKWRVNQAARNGAVKSVPSPFTALTGNYSYYDELNADSYVVESPDAIEPVGENSFTVFRYSENNLSAGVAHKGSYKTCILGFPFETVKTKKEKENLMKAILTFFETR
ncbi:xanthan lyase [Bacteroides sp. 214]|uniref:golvesin C-terminal-like domain-containing protein n=1 Tax=Bacteroides sp. 214 TaxID=2302935 RepID=UPI0013D8B9B0|nr:xanthan lyase [Bacteroides sp. 214]NDW12514.1 xanthan lyase [Bacteroides sp. 214]